jgi:hypothetical protein
MLRSARLGSAPLRTIFSPEKIDVPHDFSVPQKNWMLPHDFFHSQKKIEILYLISSER